MLRFADTNILLYSISRDPLEEAKRAIATAIIDNGDLCLSVQVLQEFYVQATRSSRRDALSHDQAAAFIRVWSRFPVQDMTLALLQSSLATRKRHQISYWDAAIVEAARASGCRELLSEDLSHGQEFSGVRIVNPFFL